MGRKWYEFGSYRLDSFARVLLRDNQPVALTPKAVETLRVLVQSSGSVVSKEALLNAVWPGTFVEEGSLTRNICALRQALGGNNGNELIETIPRRGYRFRAPVRVWEERGCHRRSVIVAPFRMLDSFGEDGLGLRLADAVVVRLALQKELRVQSAEGDAWNRRNDNGTQVAEPASGSDFTLEGTIQKQDGLVRVTAQLVETASRAAVWAEEFQERAVDVFQLVDSLAEQMAGVIGLLLSTEQRKLLSRQYTISGEAYQLYLHGRFHWIQRTEEHTRRAIGYFRQALAADPEYAPAYSALSSSYAFLPMLSSAPPSELMPRARAAAVNALDIDDTLAEARSALAFVKWHYDWDWKGAEQEFRRIIKFQPDHAITHQWYALLLMEMCRFGEALEQADLARALDDSGSIRANQASVLYFADRYQQAIDVARETLNESPESVRASSILGMALWQMGQTEEAIRELEQGYSQFKRVPFLCGALGYCYARNGRVNDALGIQKHLRSLPGGKMNLTFEALIEAGLDHTDSAIDLLEKACDKKEFHVVLLKVDRRFEGLRTSPRFQALLERVHYPACRTC